jgi:hypothetical protein
MPEATPPVKPVPFGKSPRLLLPPYLAGIVALCPMRKSWPRIAPLRDHLGVERYFVTGIPDVLRFPLSRLYRPNPVFPKY